MNNYNKKAYLKDKKSKEKSIVMMVHDNRIDRRVLDEARSLKKSGWDVLVIGGPLPYEGYDLDEKNYPELKIIRPDITKKPNIRLDSSKLLYSGIQWDQIFPLHNYFLELGLQNRANIYVAHDLPQLPAAIMLSAYYNSYIVYDSHELYPEQLNNGKIKRKLYTDIEKILLPFVDQVITVNNSISKIMSLKYEIETPEVILNCPSIDDSVLPVKNQNHIRKNLNLPDDKKILLYQGSVTRYENDIRNLDKLILAMKFIKNNDVLLVYMGPDGSRKDDLLKFADENDLLNKKFFYHQGVSQDQLLSYTASADAGIIPYPHVDFNSYYCTPNKLFEFMVVGLPILANDSPELSRFISGQKIGLNMSMGSVEEIAFAIDTFFSLDLNVFKENYKSISKAYLWSGQGEKLVGIYNRLINKEAKVKRLTGIIYSSISELIDSGNYDLARVLGNKLIKNNPKDVKATNLLAFTEFNDNNELGAIQILKDFLLVDNNNEVVLNNLNYISQFQYLKSTSTNIVKRKLQDYITTNPYQ